MLNHLKPRRNFDILITGMQIFSGKVKCYLPFYFITDCEKDCSSWVHQSFYKKQDDGEDECYERLTRSCNNTIFNIYNNQEFKDSKIGRSNIFFFGIFIFFFRKGTDVIYSHFCIYVQWVLFCIY